MWTFSDVGCDANSDVNACHFGTHTFEPGLDTFETTGSQPVLRGPKGLIARVASNELAERMHEIADAPLGERVAARYQNQSEMLLSARQVTCVQCSEVAHVPGDQGAALRCPPAENVLVGPLAQAHLLG